MPVEYDKTERIQFQYCAHNIEMECNISLHPTDNNDRHLSAEDILVWQLF